MMENAIKALAKAQTEMGKALKNASNPHLKSKYADLGAVMEACFSALHANGFAVLQPCGGDDRGQYVETILAHESGHLFTSRVYLVLAKQDMQGVGSAITYARRYGLLGMAGLAPEDDDGEAAKVQRPARQEQAPQKRPELTSAENAKALLMSSKTPADLQKTWADLYRNHRAVADMPEVIAAKDIRKDQLADQVPA